MDTIYDRLTNLPLFKGASEEIINDFAEKTPLEFRRYSPGEVIIRENQICDEVICLISGSVRRVMKYCCGRLEVSEIIKNATLMGIEHLFGLHKEFDMKVSAAEEVGLMCFPKSHYLRLLQSSQIILLNSLNYLSRFAQNGRDALKLHTLGGIASELSYLTQVTTSQLATEIYFYTPDMPIINFMSPPEKYGDYSNDNYSAVTLMDLENRGLVELIDQNTLHIPSRKRLLEQYRQES